MHRKGAFSVLMAVYIKDDEYFLDQALLSIYRNTLPPSEVILVKDGPVSQTVNSIIDNWRDKLNIKTVDLEFNIGLGEALNNGLKFCTYDLVARCDADDINRPNRFLNQVDYMCNHPEIDIISSWVQQFENEPLDKDDIRRVPAREKLFDHAKRKNPFNHPAVMFRKHIIINIGGYGKEFLYEDYALWMRLLNSGHIGDNIQEVLVDMRFSEETYMRRGGRQYLVSEFKCQFKFFRDGYLDFNTFFLNIVIRACVRLLPNALRKIIYRKVLRRTN